MKRKIIALCLTAIMCISFAACGDPDNASPSNNDNHTNSTAISSDENTVVPARSD